MENINDSDKEDIISDSPKDSLGKEEIPPDTDINEQNKIESPSNDNNVIQSEQNQEEENITFKSPVYQIIQDKEEPQIYEYQNIVQLKYQPEKSNILPKDIHNAESLNQKENEKLNELYQENTSQTQGVEYNLDFRKNIYPATQKMKPKKNKIINITRTSPVDQHRNRLKENNRNYIVKTNKIKIKNRNKEPKDSKSKIIICSSGKNNQRNISFMANWHNSNNSEISGKSYFEESPINKIKIKQNNINVQNGKYNREIFRVPMDKYSSRYESNSTQLGGSGMKRGEYKFIGQMTSINPKYKPEIKYSFSKEDILLEINKRYKVNTNSSKKLKFEVLDKFYVLTELSRGKRKIKTQDKIGCKIVKVQKHKIYKPTSNKSNEYIAFQQNNKRKNEFKKEDKFKAMVNFTRYTNSINHQNNLNLNLNYSCSAIYPSDNYSRYLLEQINKTRTDPQSFIGVIEDSKDNIIKDRYGRIIYKGKMKIALSKGESTFNEAIDFLKETRPMKKLEFNHLITPKLPINESEIIDKHDLGKKVVSMIDNGIMIKSYWRDIIRDPEISFLLMIVDDIGFKSGMRRKDILNPNMKYIGIASTEINGHFVCYITLS
jgi:hypothetical protein